MPTHGSLTKAGKTRNEHVLKSMVFRTISKQTRGRNVTRRFRGKKGKSPRVANRRRYEKRILNVSDYRKR